nr:hypothetical protein [Tanacetum cinerariifolium]
MIEEQIKNTRGVRLRGLKKRKERNECLQEKGSGVGRGVKEKQVSIGVKLVDRTKSKRDTGTGLFTKSDGTLNDAHPLKEETIAMECPMVNTPDVGPNPPLPMKEANSPSNAPGKLSYATATGKPNGKKVSVCTLFTPGGRSSYARVMIELRADVELKDNIVVAMPKITKEGRYTCNDCVEYEWKSSRCSSCKVFGHIPEECPKNTGAGEKKTVKKPSQTSQEPTIEVSNSNPFDVLNSVDNDVEFGTNRRATNLVNNGAASSGSSFINIDNNGQFASNTPIGEKIDKIERQIYEGKLRLSDNDENLLVSTSIVESDSEVEVVIDETANLRILTSGKDRSEKGGLLIIFKMEGRDEMVKGREKTPRYADATPRVNIQDFCEEYYEEILPIIMDKIRHDKRKEVHARLDFEEGFKERRIREGSHYSSARTLSARYHDQLEIFKVRDRLIYNDRNVLDRLGHRRQSAFDRLSETYSPSVTKSRPDRTSPKDRSRNRSHPHRRDSSNEDCSQSRECSRGVGESYDNSHSSYRTNHGYRYRDRDRSRRINKERDSESSLSRQKKYVKDPVEIHDIKKKDREIIEDFMVNNPELTKRLNEHVSKTMEETMITTAAFIRGEAIAAGKKKGHTPWRTQNQSKRHTSKKRSDFRGPRQFQPPPPMVTPVEKRSSNKFCDFHNDKGHSTDECMQLKKQIKELVRAGKLSHIIKEIK